MVRAKLLFLVTCMLASEAVMAQLLFRTSPSPSTNSSNHRFSELDKNRDGVLSREEAAAFPRLLAHFESMDANKDNLLSREELLSPQQEKPFKHVATRLDDRLKAADTDSDGELSKNEANTSGGLSYVAEHFDQFDANKDGKVSRDELRSSLMSHIRSR